MVEDRFNLCQSVPKYPERKRKRRLSGSELDRLGQMLNEAVLVGISATVAAAIRLTIETECRRSEVLTMRRQMSAPYSGRSVYATGSLDFARFGCRLRRCSCWKLCRVRRTTPGSLRDAYEWGRRGLAHRSGAGGAPRRAHPRHPSQHRLAVACTRRRAADCRPTSHGRDTTPARLMCREGTSRWSSIPRAAAKIQVAGTSHQVWDQTREEK